MAANVPLSFTTEDQSKPASSTRPLSINQHTTAWHPSCQHFYFGLFPGSVDSGVAEGGVRSGFQGNCQPPIPLQLNTLFHRHGCSEALFPGGRGKRRRECEMARGRERANKFCENTVIQYGRHCVPANCGWSSLLGERRWSCDD